MAGQLDRTQVQRMLSGSDRFDEATMADDDHAAPGEPERDRVLATA